MSQQSGVSASYVNSAISSLRYEMQREIETTRSEVRREIQRLEKEMIEAGRMIVNEIRDQTSRLSGNIESQTVALVGGVAANTIMLERTKNQIENDFDKTRTKLDLQTEATLQIEVGKKIAETVSTRGKLMAFASDINGRFQKSIEGIFLNRNLYSLNFNKIFDEYRNKIRTIGQHIFYIRDNDIHPAVQAAHAPLEEIHGLPFEVDLMRLKVRAQSLDETLTMLKESRFDQVLNSLDNLEADLNSNYALALNKDSTPVIHCNVVMMGLQSKLATHYLLGAQASEVGANHFVNLTHQDSLYPELFGKKAKDLMQQLLESASRSLKVEELIRLHSAVQSLQQKKLISEESALLVSEFLESDNLKLVNYS
jgi:hypothetical protein